MSSTQLFTEKAVTILTRQMTLMNSNPSKSQLENALCNLPFIAVPLDLVCVSSCLKAGAVSGDLSGDAQVLVFNMSGVRGGG